MYIKLFKRKSFGRSECNRVKWFENNHLFEKRVMSLLKEVQFVMSLKN